MISASRHKYNILKYYIYTSILVMIIEGLLGIRVQYYIITIIYMIYYMIYFNLGEFVEKNRKSKSLYFILLLFLLSNFISALNSNDILWSMNTVIDLLTRILFVIIINDAITKREQIFPIIKTFIIFLFLHYFILLYEVIFNVHLFDINTDSNYNRFYGLFNDPNFLAKQYAMFFPFAIYFANKEKKVLYTLFLVFGIIMVYATGSVSALILYAITIIIIVSPMKKIKGRSKVNIIIVAILIIVAIIYIYNNNIINNIPAYQRLMDTINFPEYGSSTFAYRQYKWEKGLEMWSDSPVWGIGPQMFPKQFSVFSYLHNSYLDILIESGLITFIILLLLIITIYIKLIRRYRATGSIFVYYFMASLILSMIAYTSLSGGFVRDMYLYLLIGIAFHEINN